MRTGQAAALSYRLMTANDTIDGRAGGGAAGSAGRWLAPAAIAAALLGFYLLFASTTTLWDRDEPRFARAAVEMAYGGDWLVPTFNAELRAHKPAGVYWLMAGSVLALGVNELAVRLPSAVMWVLVALATFAAGRLLFGRRAALWAMAIVGTAALAAYIAAAAMADAMLNAAMAGAMLAFVHRVQRGGRWWQLPAIALCLGAALLAKGPVGLAVPMLSMITAGVLLRRTDRPIGRRWWGGLALATLAGVGIFLAWAIPANQATAGAFAEQGLGRHVFERMTSAMEGHGGSDAGGYVLALGLYVPLLIAGFFPWTLHLPGALRAMIGRRLGGPTQRAVLWGWIVPTFVLMTLIVTKLPHYILPIYPPLAIACGAMIDARRGQLAEADRDWLRGGVWFFGPVAALVAVAMIGLPVFMGAALWSVAPVALLVGVAVLAIRWQLAERVGRTACLLAIATPVLMVLGMAALRPAVEGRLKISDDLAAAIHAEFEAAGATPTVYTAGYNEPSLVFYLDLPPDQQVRGGDPGALLVHGAAEPHAVLVITSQKLAKVEQQVGPIAADRIIARYPVINYSSSAEQHEVLALWLPGRR